MSWYTGNTTYDILLIVAFLYAILIGIGSRKGTATYGGRFGTKSKGVKFSPNMGWFLMEVPALLVFPIFFFMGDNWNQPVALFLGGLWMFHYMNRAVITPMLIRVAPGTQSSFNITVVVAGWATLALHSYLNGSFISQYGSHLHMEEWFSDPRFIAGLMIYICGFTINVKSDAILRNLRSKNQSADEPRYKIPYGGLFKYVTCPQYFGEILSFLGFTIMTWGLGFLYIFAVTFLNLVPRAKDTHALVPQTISRLPQRAQNDLPQDTLNIGCCRHLI